MFEIYSIGDSAFLAQVLNSVAMLCGTGDFPKLVSIGAILGVFAVCIQSIIGGVRELNIQHILIGLIVYAVFFGPSTTVTIEDSYTGQVRVVDNVPLGVGFSGSMISNIGYGVTELFEQSYQNTASMTQQPFAESLRELQAIRRNLNDASVIESLNTAINSAGNVDVARSLDNYIRECTFVKIALGEMSKEELKTKPWQEALEFNSNIYGTRLYLGNGAADENPTCAQAWPYIQAALANTNNATVIAAVNRAAGIMIDGRPQDSFNGISQALNQLNLASNDAHDFVRTAILYPIVERAAAGYYNDFGDVANATMINQAISQRNVQWSAEQTLFMTTVRPMLTFFEGFIYAITPVMGFLFVIGIFGIRLALRYFQTLLWIQLWLPVMSICNLYITMSASREMASYGANFLSSFYALERLDDVVSTWVATGGMLCAATPVVALFLVTGSTYAFTTLANRLGGSDHINEKIASPDVVQPAALFAQQAMQTGNSVSTMRAGMQSQFRSIDTNAGADAAVSSTRTEAQAAQRANNMAVSNAILNSSSHDNAARYAESLGKSMESSSDKTISSAYKATYDFAKSQGLSDTTANQYATAVTTSLGGQLGFRGGLKFGEKPGAKTSNGKKQEQIETTPKKADEGTWGFLSGFLDTALGFAGGAEAKYTDTDTAQHSQQLQELSRKLEGLDWNEGTSARLNDMVRGAESKEVADSYSRMVSESKDQRLTETNANVRSSTKAYQDAVSQKESMSLRGSWKSNDLASFIFHNGNAMAASAFMGDVQQTMTPQQRQAFNERWDTLKETGFHVTGDTSGFGVKTAAFLETMQEQGRYDVVGKLLQAATGTHPRTDYNVGNDPGSIRAHTPQAVDRNIEDLPQNFDGARSELRSQVHGDSTREQAVQSNFEASRPGVSQAHDDNRARVVGGRPGELIQQMNDVKVPKMQRELNMNTQDELREVAKRSNLTDAQTNLFVAYGQGDKTPAQDRLDTNEAKQQLLEENRQRYGDTMSESQLQRLTDGMANNLEQASWADTAQISQYLQPIRSWNDGLYAKDDVDRSRGPVNAPENNPSAETQPMTSSQMIQQMQSTRVPVTQRATTPNTQQGLRQAAEQSNFTPAQAQLLAAHGMNQSGQVGNPQEIAQAKSQLMSENMQRYGSGMSQEQVATLTNAMDHTFEQAARADSGHVQQFLQPVSNWNAAHGFNATSNVAEEPASASESPQSALIGKMWQAKVPAQQQAETHRTGAELRQAATQIQLTPAQTRLLAAHGDNNYFSFAARREKEVAQKQLLEENTQKYGQNMSKEQIQELTNAMNHNFEQAAHAERGRVTQLLQPVRAWNASQGINN